MATLATSAASISCTLSICKPTSSCSSSPAAVRLAPLSFGADKSWSSKTTTNGSRVNAFLVVNPYTNLKFETLSYLPALTQDQIFKQIDYLLKKKLIPAIEFDNIATLSRTHHAGPGYYDGRYWTLWRLPLFGANDPSQVLREIQEAKHEYPDAYIRVIGFDNIRQVQSTGFIVYKPDSA